MKKIVVVKPAPPFMFWVGVAVCLVELWTAWEGKPHKVFGFMVEPIWHYLLAAFQIVFLLLMFPSPKKGGANRFSKEDPWGEK